MKISLATARMTHGQCCACPRCGTVGRFQSRNEKKARFADHVRYSDEWEEFECYACEDDR